MPAFQHNDLTQSNCTHGKMFKVDLKVCDIPDAQTNLDTYKMDCFINVGERSFFPLELCSIT